MNDNELKKIASFGDLMNNPNIQDYKIQSVKGDIVKPKTMNMKKNKQEELYTPKDVVEFLKDKKTPSRITHDRLLLIKLYEDESKDIFKANEHGIFVDSADNKKSIYGRMGERMIEEEHKWDKYYVVQVGPGMGNIDMQIQQGEIIEVGYFAGYPFTYKGIDYKIARDSDVLCVVPE